MGCSGIGFQEGLIILGVIVVVMGAGRIPQLGDALGRSILNFRRAMRGQDELDVTKSKRIEPGEDDDESNPPRA